MKKITAICLLLLSLGKYQLMGQEFSLKNAQIIPAIGKETVTFDFSTTKAFTFSSNDLSNDYATLMLGTGKMNPSSSEPKGNGADLFSWKLLATPGQQGGGKVYTWVGISKDTRMLANTTYKISLSFPKLAGNAAGRLGNEEMMLTAQFSDPASIPSGNDEDNVLMVKRKKEKNK